MHNRDIRIRIDNKGFVLRVAALIIENDKLLMVKHKDYPPLYTVGGGVEMGETTSAAVIREAYEETGYAYEIDRLLYIQERFFPFGGIQNHEVTFYYLMTASQSGICEGKHTDHETESLHWVHLRDLPKTNVVPSFLKTALQVIPETVQHIMTVDE